jgi:hypothetical protein
VPLLVGTAVLPETLRQEFAAKAPAGLALLPIHSVRSLGVGVYLQDTQLTIAAELRCDAQEACAALRTALLQARFEAGKKLSVRLAGFSALLDSVTATVEPDAAGSGAFVLRMRAADTASSVAQALQRVLATALTQPSIVPPLGQPRVQPLRREPDELLRPRPASAPTP